MQLYVIINGTMQGRKGEAANSDRLENSMLESSAILEESFTLVMLMLNAHLPTGRRQYIANCRLRIGYRRSSVCVCQMPTRSSGFVSTIPPIQNLNRR